MNTKANSIGIAPALIIPARRRGVNASAASVALTRAIRTRNVVFPAQSQLWTGLSSADRRAEEFWETLSYLAIWFCGLAGVALCFL